MKLKNILCCTLFITILASSFAVPASAEPKANRNIETVTSIEVGETGNAFPIKKVNKQGEKLTGAKFIGYHITEGSDELEERKRLTDLYGFRTTIDPDLESNDIVGDNINLAIFVAGSYFNSGAYVKVTHIVLKEITTPEGYEKETGKLYYIEVGAYDREKKGRKLTIAPQSQDDCYFTDDGTLVLENSKEAAATPGVPTEPEKQKPEEKTNNNTDSAKNTPKENNNSNSTTAAQTGDMLNAKGYIFLLVLAGGAFVCNVALKKAKSANEQG